MTEPDYFSLSTFRLLPDMAAAKYPDALVLDAAAYIVGVIERVVGTSFVPRTITDEVHDGNGRTAIALRNPFVLAVSSVEIDGVPVVGETFTARSGVLRRFAAGSSVAGTWPSGDANISVTYSSGYSTTPPGDLASAAMQGTRARLLETASTAGISDRRTSITNEAGTISFVVAGEDQPTGFPVVDAVIVGYREKLDVFGFA